MNNKTITTIILLILIVAMNLLNVNCYDKCNSVDCPRLKCAKNEIVEVPKGECCGRCKSICLEMCKETKCPLGYTKSKILGSCCETCIEHREVNYDNIKANHNNNNNNKKKNNNTTQSANGNNLNNNKDHDDKNRDNDTSKRI